MVFSSLRFRKFAHRADLMLYITERIHRRLRELVVLHSYTWKSLRSSRREPTKIFCSAGGCTKAQGFASYPSQAAGDKIDLSLSGYLIASPGGLAAALKRATRVRRLPSTRTRNPPTAAAATVFTLFLALLSRAPSQNTLHY